MTHTIQDLSTRELLSAFRALRIEGRSGCGPNTGADTVVVGSRLHPGGVVGGVSCTEDELLAEIALRPHVPSKQEGRVIRRLQAQTGWTAEELRAHTRFGMEIADAQYPNRQEVSPEFAERNADLYGKSFGRLFKVITT